MPVNNGGPITAGKPRPNWPGQCGRARWWDYTPSSILHAPERGCNREEEIGLGHLCPEET